MYSLHRTVYIYNVHTVRRYSCNDVCYISVRCTMYNVHCTTKYQEMKTNEYIKDVMISLIGTYEPILSSIRRRKLIWYGHKIRHDNLSKTILQGMFDQGTIERNLKCSRPKRKWIDDIKVWSKITQSDLMLKPHERNEWRRHCIIARSLVSTTIRESRE